jgi:hypothetical protein
MTTTVVQYKVRQDAVALNEELLREAFAELEQVRPAGLRYRVLVLDDGVSFVHIVEYEGENPLPAIPSFKRYLADVRGRLQGEPAVGQASELGSIDGRTPVGAS